MRNSGLRALALLALMQAPAVQAFSGGSGVLSCAWGAKGADLLRTGQPSSIPVACWSRGTWGARAGTLRGRIVHQMSFETKQGSKEEVDPADATSSYDKSSGLVKSIVGGLTNIVNSVMARDAEVEDTADDRRSISLEELRDGIEGDYLRYYLWTGDIDPFLYDKQCRFTDPTISFQGLSTFQKNLANLRPIIDTLIKDYDVELYKCELQEPKQQVVARWRMVGRLALPWQPYIDLIGSTRFKYEPSRGNRITEYFETWETPAGEVLLNLLKPGGNEKRTERA